jgi:hypothetical protein
MDRAENEIEPVPVFLDPLPTSGGTFRIVIQLEASTNFHIGICVAQFIDFVEIDSFVIPVVIGKGDVGKPAFPRAIDPGLEKISTVRLDPVALRMRVVVGKELRVNG